MTIKNYGGVFNRNPTFNTLKVENGFTVAGKIAVINGVVDAPAIAPTDDPNTGIFFPAADTIAFTEGGVETMRVTSDRYLRMASGSLGIQFNGDTLAANALDDYEEGTWTPQYTFATSGTATMTVSSLGAYTKVGRMVTVTFVALTSSISSPTGQATITGLPFTSAATFFYGGAVGEVRRLGTDMPNLKLGVNANEASIFLYKQATNSATSTFVDGSDFVGTANYNRIQGTLTYFV
jgi:hypothetical protein